MPLKIAISPSSRSLAVGLILLCIPMLCGCDDAAPPPPPPATQPLAYVQTLPAATRPWTGQQEQVLLEMTNAMVDLHEILRHVIDARTARRAAEPIRVIIDHQQTILKQWQRIPEPQRQALNKAYKPQGVIIIKRVAVEFERCKHTPAIWAHLGPVFKQKPQPE